MGKCRQRWVEHFLWALWVLTIIFTLSKLGNDIRREIFRLINNVKKLIKYLYELDGALMISTLSPPMLDGNSKLGTENSHPSATIPTVGNDPVYHEKGLICH